MSDDTYTPDGDDVEEPQEALRDPEFEAEPEGGPFERQREFLEKRLTPLRPKQAAGGLEGREVVAPLVEPQEEPIIIVEEPAGPPAREAAVEEQAGPVFDRKAMIDEYRDRQRAQAERETGAESTEDSAEEDEGEGEGGDDPSALGLEDARPPSIEPPEAPQPPPATNWIPIGPSVLRRGQAATEPATSGRTPGIAVAPGGDRVYIAAANGGVWRSEDTGDTWIPLMNAFDLNPQTAASDSLACGAIALVPGATAGLDRLYVGSGEGPGGAYFGVGPVVSSDGGANWSTEPVSATSPQIAGSAFYALAVDPADPDRVVGGTRMGLYRRESDGSGGFEWDRKTTPGAGSNWFTGVVAARTGGTTTFYASSWFGPVFSSNDGDVWVAVGTGFPTANVGRIGLAVQTDNPSVLYALIHNSANGAALGIWRLDTSDNTWRQVTGHPPFLFGNPDPNVSPGVQGRYDLAIAVDPNNVNRIYLGGSTVLSGGAWSASLNRSDVTSAGAGAGFTYSMTNTYIGASVHADVHTFAFAPGDSNKLWVGCDGGVFYSTNPTGTGNIFTPRNTGLATLTMEHLGHHPTEDAVVFCGTQDNGGARFTGEEAWLHSVWGDSGFFVVNWNDPYKIAATYVRASVNRTTDGGTRYNYGSISVPLAMNEPVGFYAPLVGTPFNPGTPAEAERIAFGSTRPWISDTFGGGWGSIPNDDATDMLGNTNTARIVCLIFAAHDKLYAGLQDGRVYRYDEGSGGTWTRTQLDTLGGANALPLAGIITDIAVDRADATGNSIYITFGGFGDYRHVWHFDGTQWSERSGPIAGDPGSLLDVQHNAIVTDPANTNDVYVGSDLGVWRSTDAGNTWAPFSEGVPDASVLDLKLHEGRRLLRASTHGRGVFERLIDAPSAQGIELYVRDTQLDQGRFTTVNWLPDPTDQGETVRHWRGPDIKVDTPDFAGQYEFPLIGDIDFNEFVDVLTDDSRNVATHVTATITSRVYVQVHNRGVTPANGVQVMLLLSNASAGLPPLPAGYEADVQAGNPINNADWQTLDIKPLNDIRVGFPKVASFSLTSDKLPPPSNLAGNDHHCLLALVHHAADPYTSTETITDTNSKQERKAAHKNLKVVQFLGTVPSPPPMMVAFRINNADLRRQLVTDLVIDLNRYQGGVRLFLPELKIDGELRESIDGFEFDHNLDDFKRWAEEQTELIQANWRSGSPYNKLWTGQRMKDIEAASQPDFSLRAQGQERVSVKRIVMSPGSYHTCFLMLDRPREGRIGNSYEFDILQLESGEGSVIGGLTTRVELVPQPRVRHTLKLWAMASRFGYSIIRADLMDAAGRRIEPVDGAAISLTMRFGSRKATVKMQFHRSWRSFYHYVRVLDDTRVSIHARGLVHGDVVAEATLQRRPGERELMAVAGHEGTESAQAQEETTIR